MLKLINIKKNYANRIVLQNIFLDFTAKERVAVVGPSGCGKTTLLNLIGGLDHFSTGDLVIDNVSTQKYSSADWDSYRNKNIGFVFQHYNLIAHLNVYDNIEMALMMSGFSKKERKEKVLRVMDQVGLLEHAAKKPAKLSGGEQQRVAIARAIVNNPDIILADEPTGALDSKSANEIMDLLYEVSEGRLLIMVTHNIELAEKYSTRIIRLQDGQVISDSNPQVLTPKETKILKPKSKSMRISSALKLSVNNLFTKKLRTSLTILAGSIGIVGLSLVMMFSNVVTNYMDELQKNTLANYPITIRSTVDNTDPNRENVNYTPYPDTQEVRVVRDYASYSGHINKFEESFLNYLGELDSALYNVIDYNTNIEIKLLTNTYGIIRRVGTSYFSQMSDDVDYLRTQYDVLAGDFPTSKNQLALVVDRYNNIDVVVLEGLGIDYINIEKISFDELQEKEYRVISNDDFYTITESGTYTSMPSTDMQRLYDSSGFPLKIAGVLRPKKNAATQIYASGVLYSSELAKEVIEQAKGSQIVQDQLRYGLSKDVLTGKPFEDESTIYSTRSKEFLYEQRLSGLSQHARINTVTIYTDLFRSRLLINDYLEKYNFDKNTENKVLYNDYMGNVTLEFDAFISILTRVLLIFALIALFVSSIMTGILTYVGVVERTKEIGILRSLGSRKIDIGMIINSESGLIGLISGVVGVILGFLFFTPIVGFISDVLKQNNVKTFDLTLLNYGQVQTWYLGLVVVGSVLLSMVSGLAPALIAAHKKPVEAIRVE